MRVFALLLLLVLPLAAMAEVRPEGLAFNRSGLPATLPLLIATDPGRDVYVELLDAEGRAVLAAHAHGGAPFRVLVPPGRWQVRFALGNGWEGEGRLFGDETERIALEAPLGFGASAARLSGYLVDLRGGVPRVVPRGLCQRPAAVPAPKGPQRVERDWAEGIAPDPFDPRAAEDRRWGDFPQMLPRSERVRPWDRDALEHTLRALRPALRQRPGRDAPPATWLCD